MIKVEIQGVNVLDIYNQLKSTLQQFREFVDHDRAMDDRTLPGQQPTVNAVNLAPQGATVAPTIAVTAQPDTVAATTPNTAVQVTPTQVAVTAPVVTVEPNTPVQQPPVQQVATTTAPVSQDVKKYALPEIQAALAPLLDAGKTAELQQLMTQFGVQYLGQVPEDRYPELVNAIRGLGARI